MRRKSTSRMLSLRRVRASANFNFENFASQKFSLIHCDFSLRYEIAFFDSVRKLKLSSLSKIKERRFRRDETATR